MLNVHHEELPLVVQNENVLVDALLLHRKLKVGSIYQNWIKRRIDEFNFEKRKDYFPNLEIVKGSKKPVTKYLITLDMAKELAMLERNEVGRSIRRYFIAKEKELRGISQLPKEAHLFKGLKLEKINGRKLYPYRELLGKIGYNNTSGGCGARVHKYPGHFVKMGSTWHITEEFALHLHHQKQVINNRATLKAMQPVLALNFGEDAL